MLGKNEDQNVAMGEAVGVKDRREGAVKDLEVT